MTVIDTATMHYRVQADNDAIHFSTLLLTGQAHTSGYLTADEAEELSDALWATARMVRGMALDSGLTAKDSSPEHSPVLDGFKR